MTSSALFSGLSRFARTPVPPPSGWFSRLLLECCYSAGRATRLENAPAGSLANAAFVGAKTVYSKLYALRNNVSFRTYA